MAKTSWMALAASLLVLAGMPAAAQVAADSANAFNRLLKPAAQRNLPPAEDGIHDPANPGTRMLQAPLESFGPLPKRNSGNRVDWVGAQAAGKIRPLWNAADHKESAAAFDLNIVREVKGSMPDVVFPHKQHTEQLDCAICHPAIFVPQKGANQMSMASIILGQGCGACHGRVAFPIVECRLCHSRAKKAAGAGAQAVERQAKR